LKSIIEYTPKLLGARSLESTRAATIPYKKRLVRSFSRAPFSIGTLRRIVLYFLLRAASSSTY
jgi:hypothetical protein